MRIFGHDNRNMELDEDYLSMQYGSPWDDHSDFGLYINKEEARLIVEALKDKFNL